MKHQVIYFVTSNKAKYKLFAERINSSSVKIEQLETDLNEIQALDGVEITKHKLKQAINMYPNKRLIVEDRGFFITALKGFPGPFVKLILKSVGVEGLLELMRTQQNREAKFISILGYFDGQEEHYFIDEEVGFLATAKKGNNLRGWTELMYIYGYKTFANKTLAELTDKEWSLYEKELAKNDYLKKFTKFLKLNKKI